MNDHKDAALVIDMRSQKHFSHIQLEKSVNFSLEKMIFERVFWKILKFFPKIFENFEKICFSPLLSHFYSVFTKNYSLGHFYSVLDRKTKFQECQFRANTLEDATL